MANSVKLNFSNCHICKLMALNGELFCASACTVLMLPGIVRLVVIIPPFPDATEAFGRQFQNGKLRISDRVEIGIH
jgi:hypothetical protein